MFDTIESARKFAQDMAHKYHQSWYVVTWRRSPSVVYFEAVSAVDMYYHMLQQSERFDDR